MTLGGVSKCKNHCVSTFVSLKKGLMRHVITPRTLLDAHGPKEVSESIQHDLKTHRKFFHTSQSQHLHSITCNFCTILLFFRGKSLLEGYQNAKIIVFLHLRLCVNKKGLVRHVITPRTLLDAHGPKEVSESKQYDVTTHRKFFHASQSQRLDSLTCNFCTIYL